MSYDIQQHTKLEIIDDMEDGKDGHGRPQCLYNITHSHNDAMWTRFVCIMTVAAREFHHLGGPHALQRAIEWVSMPLFIIHGCYHPSHLCSDGHTPSSSHRNL